MYGQSCPPGGEITVAARRGVVVMLTWESKHGHATARYVFGAVIPSEVAAATESRNLAVVFAFAPSGATVF
jgi:hypothetical protein